MRDPVNDIHENGGLKMDEIKRADNCGLGNRGKVLTLIIIAAWIVVGLAGILIDSSPHRTRIVSGIGGFWALLLSWLTVLLV